MSDDQRPDPFPSARFMWTFLVGLVLPMWLGFLGCAAHALWTMYRS